MSDAPSWNQSEEVYMRMDKSGQMYTVTEYTTPVDITGAVNQFLTDTGYLSPLLAENTYTYLKGMQSLAIQIVKAVPFRIEMELDHSSVKQTSDKDEVLYKPAFADLERGLDVSPPFMYTPPTGQRLLFIAELHDTHTYLIAQDLVTGHLYHPNLPNVYGDGKLCLGEVLRPRFDQAKGIQNYLDLLYRAWSAAKWNSDLINHCGDAEHWLRFSESTMASAHPTDKPWQEYTVKLGPPTHVGEAIALLHQSRASVLGSSVA